jgi:hypothetical protein
MNEVKVQIDEIRDHVENNKPVSEEVAQQWLQFLLRKHDSMEQRVHRLTRNHLIPD